MMRACGLGLFAFAAAVSPAQDPVGDVSKIESKGQKGQLVPAPFRAYMVVDTRYPLKVPGSTNPDDRNPKDTTNRMHDLVTEHGLNPVVAVFTRSDAKKLGDSGVHKLVSEMNNLMMIPDYRGNKLASFVTFLKIEGMLKSVELENPDKTRTKVELDAEYPDDEKRDVHADEIKLLAKFIKESDERKATTQGREVPKQSVVFGLAPATSKAADAWSIGEKDDVTVVFFNRGKIVERWTFGAEGPDEAQIKTILGVVEESVLGTKKP